MFVLARAATYATVFISLVLIYLPSRFLDWSGMARPVSVDTMQMAGIVISTFGAVIVLWSVLSFAFMGRGTPAPFDPPRKLVIQGPYQYVRNPMYVGAGFALAGAAIFYESLPLTGYMALFFLITHLFVIWYEEPTLKRSFGADYDLYCGQVRRWIPKLLK